MSEAPRSPILYPVSTTWQQKPPMGTPLDWSHPLTRGLECCWLFNEGSGPYVYDATGNGHTAIFGGQGGQPTNGAWDAANATVIHGPAMQFRTTGAANTGNITQPIVIPQGEFTAEFWIKHHLTVPGIASTLLRNPTGDTLSYIMVQRDPTSTEGFLRYAEPGATHSATLLFPYGTWTHIAVTQQPHPTEAGKGLLQFWVNGAYRDHTVSFPTLFQWIRFTNSVAGEPFYGAVALGRIWTRALRQEEILGLYTTPFAMFRRRPTLLRATRTPMPPVHMQWAAQALLRVPFALPSPARVQWHTQMLRASGTLSDPTPSRIRWQVNSFHRAIMVEPVRMSWNTSRQQLPVGLVLRDCGEVYEAALQKTMIGGDWLISAPAIGLNLSFNYNSGDAFEHRILDISDIEISAPPGGGIASVANVTVSIAETHRGQSIVTLWEQASAVGSVRVTIDFLLAGADHVLRIFTGAIDSIVVKDAIAQLLLVDDSIQHNLIIPHDIITAEEYPSADTAALTKAPPLIYGQGSKIGAAPMLFVDVTNNVYLVADHPMRLGGLLAVYDQPTQTFLMLPSILLIPNNGIATITLGTLATAPLLPAYYAHVLNTTYATDGNSATKTTVQTLGAFDFSDISMVSTNGGGYLVWSLTGPQGLAYGAPTAPTFQVTLTNHRRVQGSDPTTTGQFFVRARRSSGLRYLFVSPAFNHVTSAQTNIFTLSNTNIGINEVLEVVLATQCQGTIGNTSQSYEIGEVSLTPLVAFSANVSGRPTAVGLPINIQELRFNPQQLALSVLFGSHGVNPTHAIDGNSTTWAHIGTSQVDSNLDGYGELIIVADTTSAQRANNTVVIDLVRHRRNPASTPTVTGTFAIQTYNTATGVLLRDNLFVTQAFRHATNPLSTSYVATAINLGANTKLAVRAVARNEGGVGGPDQEYEVGEIGIETFYQPRGDSGDIYLFGEGYEGRTDITGTVTDYIGSAPGRLYQTPDMVIASMYEDELMLLADHASFATAYNFYAGLALRFDGGIGAGWAIEQTNARDLLDAMAKQATAILFPTFEATWGMRPFRSETAVHQDFDGSTILTEMGSEQQRAEDRTSSVQLTLGNLQNVYNHFEVRFKYNAGSRKYDGVWKVTKDGSNLPDGTLDKAEIEQTCLESWLRYGDLEPLIVEAYWIADETTAAYYLRHLALYFAQQRLGVQFDTTFKAACLQVGDFVTITDNSLPSGDNGGVFEVHTIRYMPLKGRIQLVTSRVSTIPDVPIPTPPAALTGCARFTGSAGMLACWDFEELNGSRIDHLYEYSLAAVNNPLGVPGKVGNAVQFVRASSQYLTSDNLLSGIFTGAFTLACWVRLLSVPSDYWAIVMNESPLTSYPQREIFFGLQAGGYVHVGVGENNIGGELTATAATLPFTGTENDWTLLRCWRTFDASFNGTLYVQINNGIIENTAFTNALPHAHDGFSVGAGSEGGVFTYHANLLLDQLQIWQRVLSQTELDLIWNGGAG